MFKNLVKASAILGGLGLLCGASFWTGRVRGWIDVVYLEAVILKEYSEQKKQTETEQK